MQLALRGFSTKQHAAKGKRWRKRFEFRQSYPHLSLAQIHASLAYYYDHKVEVDAQVEDTLRVSESFRAQAADQPSRQELLDRLARNAGAKDIPS